MSAADHETALREVLRTARHPGEPLLHGEVFKAGCPACEAEVALDALVGLLRQTEQERDRAHSEGVLWAQSRMQKRLSEAEQEVERLKRGNQERENQIRETPTGVVVEVGTCECGHPRGTHWYDNTANPAPEFGAGRCHATIYTNVQNGVNAKPCNCPRFAERETPQSGVEEEAGGYGVTLQGQGSSAATGHDNKVSAWIAIVYCAAFWLALACALVWAVYEVA